MSINEIEKPIKLLDMLEGTRSVRNILGFADPDVHKFGNQWHMFIGGFQSNFKNNLFCLTLPPDAPLSSDQWSFKTIKSNPTTALPLVPQPSKGSWDEYGLHTPSYVRGISNTEEGTVQCERIYYAGRGSRSVTNNTKPYSIGVIERSDKGWIRREIPILTGTRERPSVLEPKARYFENKWRIWYVSTPKELPRGELPNYQIEYVESEDGISNWTAPQILFSTAEGFYDAVITAVDDGYEMITCRSSNLHSTANFPPQGLWWLHSKTPTGNRQDWTSKPIQILDTEGGEAWYGNGIFGPSIQYGETPEDKDMLYIFFTGVYHNANWFSLTLKRLLAFKKPPVPSPYYFALGRIQVPKQWLRNSQQEQH